MVDPSVIMTPVVLIPYSACGLLIVIYAWGRFNTPPSNRSSTRQALYWWSGLGYVLSALMLFAGLCFLLQAGEWRTLIFGPADNPALSASLMATLAMTTLLPSIPVLKRADEWLLAVFLDWAEIPAEVKRRAALMTPRSFEVTETDVAELRETYGDEGSGHASARHLRGRRGEGLELSQYRFTRVVKLYDRIGKLAGEPRYSHFFAETQDEFGELEKRVGEFLRRAGASLTLAERQDGLDEGEAFEELIAERRAEFAQQCSEIFVALARFLARAVLRSERSERDIVRRLREIGFSAAEPMNLPNFPIDSLAVLALTLFLYLIFASWMFAQAAGATGKPVNGLAMAGKITLVRLVTIGVTVWLMQRYAFFHRMPGEPPHYFAYLVNGLIAAAVAFAVCLPFDFANAGNMLPPALLSFAVCTAVALCCDDWIEDRPAPFWLRFAEAAGCGAVMAVSVILLYFGDMMTFRAGSLPPEAFALLIILPSGLACVIGGYVPHIYRTAHHAALARRDEAKRLSDSARPMLTALAEQRRSKVRSGAVAGKAPRRKRALSRPAEHDILRKNRTNVSSEAVDQRAPAEPPSAPENGRPESVDALV
ncbi:MAG: hypothetical protein JO095_07615 [Alphaproteobacteria bacterium]|nr:hypothetical protein [Alphaproteobacteria bacterium]